MKQNRVVEYELVASIVDSPVKQEKPLWLLISIDEIGCPLAGELCGLPLDLRTVEHLYGQLFELEGAS
jgi:hypothetical protein